ncbi:MAG: transposase [Spiroplasma poulsonii]|uniref:Transposase n=1 Tax=Spiroplasma poulsonii TaxID=2138 RepID=A0A2P6FBS5_9MOLU|nr:transposase [Spiroplasma poulsonii]KAF0851322.1 Transposase [Spiroplasma poulsonii]MBW1241667.1 transposase [Spiroplasma poulsonii]PQM30915.1 Transposase [Spiroplasma poulsonii]PWF95909.1 Transposase [Spiroplasma poulsonii]PWF98685.1 Transposase [Spiroplasma poulsonii]
MAKNHYTDEFKQQIVGLYKTGKTAKQLSSDYQVGKSTVWKWIHEFNNSGSFKAKDNRSPEENEIIQLRKEIKQLRMENDILKQATLIIGKK